MNAESELQLVMMSASFQQSLLVVERSVLRNAFQPQLAAYRQLPVLEGHQSTHMQIHIYSLDSFNVLSLFS